MAPLLLAAPDDHETPDVPGAGCPVPPTSEATHEDLSRVDVTCPPYDGATSQTHRSDSARSSCGSGD